jgi:hypothetical protein
VAKLYLPEKLQRQRDELISAINIKKDKQTRVAI